MKVYVDELPKSCNECPCMNEDYERGRWCNIETSLDIQTDYDKETFTSKCHRQRHEECPLQSLADYTKQVRKEVCEEIKDLAVNYFELPCCDNCGETNYDDVVLTGNDLTEILEQILGE